MNHGRKVHKVPRYRGNRYTDVPPTSSIDYIPYNFCVDPEWRDGVGKTNYGDLVKTWNYASPQGYGSNQGSDIEDGEDAEIKTGSGTGATRSNAGSEGEDGG